jgi:hypothetical protein
MRKTGKVLLAFAMAALALTAFASSAMAQGQIRDVEGVHKTIENGRTLHLIGWAEFADEAVPANGYKCDVTAILHTDVEGGTTGTITEFTIPDTTKCEGTGILKGCVLTAHQSTNLPWHVTTTTVPPDFDITEGNIVIHNTFKAGTCEPVFLLGRATEATLTFTKGITARPVKTGTEVNTGTSNTLGATAALGDPIAGIELSGKGIAHIKFEHGEQTPEVNVTGKLELTPPDRCTWTISKT